MPTPAGERAAAAAERIETEAATLGRDIVGHDLRLTGRLRVTSSETLAFRLLTKAIGQFRSAHPGITVELAIDNRVPACRAARLTWRCASCVHVSSICTAASSRRSPGQSHARSDTLGGHPRSLETLSKLPVIGWEDGVRGINAAEWLADQVSEEKIVYRTNSVVNQLVAARAGIGAAILPCYLGDPEPDLVRLSDPLPELERELRIVTHSDLKHTARIRAFLDMVGDALVADRPLLTGRM